MAKNNLRIGILEMGRLPEELARRHGDVPRLIRDLFAASPEIEFPLFPVAFGGPVPKPSACDGWILTGSEASVYEDHGWIPPSMQFVREAMENSVPVLGICFGHQLMAQAMGGKVEKSEKGRGLGIHRYDLTEAGRKLMPGFDAINLAASHQDQVVAPPPDAVLLAKSPFCSHAAFAYGDSGLSLQAHPEFTVAVARDTSHAWQEAAPVPEAAFAEAMRTLDIIPQDAQHIAPVLSDFLTRRARGQNADARRSFG